jgi:hypothetical protein
MPSQPSRYGTLTLADADYCYGIGTLMIRVDRIDWEHPTRYDNDWFLPVEGVELSADNHERKRRQVLVRASKLPARPRQSGPPKRDLKVSNE